MVGEHTEELLSCILGYNKEKIEDLRNRRVI